MFIYYHEDIRKWKNKRNTKPTLHKKTSRSIISVFKKKTDIDSTEVESKWNFQMGYEMIE